MSYDMMKEIILPLLAIIISIGSVIVAVRIQKKVYKKTLLSEIFEKNFLDILMNRLPDILDDIELDSEGRIKDEFIINIEDIVSEILMKSKFYKYYDEAFYNNVKSKLIKIEDYVFEIANMSNLNNGKRLEDIRNTIETLAEDFYKLMMEHYCKL